jgi:hypothetical protein
MSNNVGPISFSVDVVRAFLENNGIVCTYRQRRTVGKTWFNEGRGHKSLGKCIVTEIGKMSSFISEMHVTLSGFNSVEEWMAIVGEVHGSDKVLYLYKVEAKRTK